MNNSKRHRNKLLSALLIASFLLMTSQYYSSTIIPAKASLPDQTFNCLATGQAYETGSSYSGNYNYTKTVDGVYHKSIGMRGYEEGQRTYELILNYTFDTGKSARIIPNLSKVEVNGEARTNIATTKGASVFVYIYKYKQETWEQIASFYGSTANTQFTWSNTSDALNYVSNEGKMQLQWSFFTYQGDFTTLWVDYQSAKLTLKPFKWNFMVYVAADWYRDVVPEPGTGDAWAAEDINEMETVGSTADVAVTVQIDYFTNTVTSKDGRLFIVKDTNTSSISSPYLTTTSQYHMGWSNTLAEFINWSVSNFPAERCALVLWDHGFGWKGSCEDTNGNNSPPESNPPDILTTSELHNGLSVAKNYTGRTINLIGFMACLMQNTEVAYEIRDYANVFVASEEVIRSDIGWRFDAILSFLTSNPSIDEELLAQIIVWDYECHCNGISIPDFPPTLSSVNISRMVNLATFVDDFASALIGDLDSVRNQINMCRGQSREFGVDPDLIDLYNFTEATLGISNTTIQNAANALLCEISNATVIYEWHDQTKDAHGTSIYFPKISTDYNGNMYGSLDFTSTHWDEFLEAYLGVQ